MGLRTAADAAGQLIFLPLLEMFAQRYGGGGLCRRDPGRLHMLPVVAILLPEWPANIERVSPPTVLRRRAAKRLRARRGGVRSRDMEIFLLESGGVGGLIGSLLS